MCRRVAIWSMKTPVPPAQVPFMRCSGVGVQVGELGVTPPSSMTTSTPGWRRWVAWCRR